MEAVKLFEKSKKEALDWEYDGEADTLYLSFGRLRKAVGIDAGKGVIIRYDEASKEVVGLTIIGVGRQLERYLSKRS